MAEGRNRFSVLSYPVRSATRRMFLDRRRWRVLPYLVAGRIDGGGCGLEFRRAGATRFCPGVQIASDLDEGPA